jgi:hypothetical protein
MSVPPLFPESKPLLSGTSSSELHFAQRQERNFGQYVVIVVRNNDNSLHVRGLTEIHLFKDIICTSSQSKVHTDRLHARLY